MQRSSLFEALHKKIKNSIVLIQGRMLGVTSNFDDELRHFKDRYLLQKFHRPRVRTSIALLRLNLINPLEPKAMQECKFQKNICF